MNPVLPTPVPVADSAGITSLAPIQRPMDGAGQSFQSPMAPSDPLAEKRARRDKLRKMKRLHELRQMKAQAEAETTPPNEAGMIADMRLRYGDERADQMLAEREQVKAGNPLDLEQRANSELSPMDRFAMSRPMSAIAGAGQGATLGFNDEIVGAAAFMTGGGGDGYIKARDTVRRSNEAIRDMHPVSYFAGELGGGLATGGAAIGRNAASTGYRHAIAQGAKTGAAYGGAYGVGTGSDGVSNRLQSGVIGAVAGGAGGAILQPITRALGQGITRIASTGKAAKADRLILREVMRANGVDETKALQMIRDTNPDDPQVAFQKLGLVEFAAGVDTRSPGASLLFADAITKQQRGQQRRISESVKRIIGADDFTSLSNDAAETLRREGTQLYEAVLGEPIQKTPALERLLKRPSMRHAMKKARKMAADSGDDPWNESLASYQVAKEALDDLVSARFRQGKGSEARAVDRLRQELLSELDAQVPGYAKARSVWSGTKANQAALEYGRNALKLRAEDVSRSTANYSKSERQHLLAGLLQGVDDRLKKASLSHDATTRFNAEGLRDVFRTILSDEQAKRLVSMLDGESTLTATGRQVRGSIGSQTQPRQAAGRRVSHMVSRPVGRAVSYAAENAATPVESTKRFLQTLGGMARREDPAVIEALAIRLAGTPDELAAAMSRLSPASQNRAYQLARALEARSGIAAGVMAPNGT